MSEPRFERMAWMLKRAIDEHPQLAEQNMRLIAETLHQVWTASMEAQPPVAEGRAYPVVVKEYTVKPEGRHPEGNRIARIVQRVAELPDRTSPDDWPEAMLVTSDELQSILREELVEGRQEPEEKP